MFNITLSKGPRIWFSNIRQHFHPYFLIFAIYERRAKWRVNKITSGEVEQEFISKSNFYKIQINVCIAINWKKKQKKHAYTQFELAHIK